MSSVHPYDAADVNNFANPALWAECLKKQPIPKEFLFAQIPTAKILNFAVEDQIRQSRAAAFAHITNPGKAEDVIFGCWLMRNLGVQLITLPYFACTKDALLKKMGTDLRAHESRLIVEK